jgi:hypothetical protein
MGTTQTPGTGTNCTYVPRHAAADMTPTTRMHPVKDETAKAHLKVRTHITLIVLSGSISTVLYIVHAADPMLLGFAPIAPSIVQEIIDRIKYL